MTSVVPTPTSASSSAPTLRVCFDLPESFVHIQHMRKASRCYVESLGLCVQDTDDLELLLGELSTNVVRHAKAGKYHVALEMFTDRFIVVVTDCGVGFPADVPPPDPHVEDTTYPGTWRPDPLLAGGELRFGGMGLMLIRAIADQVDISTSHPQGTTVRAAKNLRVPSAA